MLLFGSSVCHETSIYILMSYFRRDDEALLAAALTGFM